MKRYKKILLVLNHRFTKAEIKQTAAMVKANKATITIVEIMKDLPKKLSKIDHQVDDVDIKELIMAERTDRLLDAAEELQQHDIKAEVKVLTGKPHKALAAFFKRESFDLIITTPENDYQQGQFLSSTNIFLMRQRKEPLWLLKPTRAKKKAHIMVCVDVAPEDDAKKKLNQKILQFALELAEATDIELHVLAAWRFYGESAMRSGFIRKPKDEIDALVKQHRQQCATELQKMIAQYDGAGLTIKTHLVKGSPGEVIPTTAKKESIDTIIMGTLCRSGIEGYMVGNTVENVLRQVECSVLAIKGKE